MMNKTDERLERLIKGFKSYTESKADQIVEVRDSQPDPSITEFPVINRYWKDNPFISEYIHYDAELYVMFRTVLADGYPKMSVTLYSDEGYHYQELLTVRMEYPSLMSDAYFLTKKYKGRYIIPEEEVLNSRLKMASAIHKELQDALWNY